MLGCCLPVLLSAMGTNVCIWTKSAPLLHLREESRISPGLTKKKKKTFSLIETVYSSWKVYDEHFFFLFLFPIFLIALIFTVKERPEREWLRRADEVAVSWGFFFYFEKNPNPQNTGSVTPGRITLSSGKAVLLHQNKTAVDLLLLWSVALGIDAVPRISTAKGDASRNSVIGKIMAGKCNWGIIYIHVLSKVDNSLFLPRSRREENE